MKVKTYEYRDYKFSKDYFKKIMDCNVYDFLGRLSGSMNGLIDHAFIADRACVWGGDDLEGHEIAVISRTYCNDNIIDNPPYGLRCYRLPKDVMGNDDKGTAIAVVVVKPTIAAELLLSGCVIMPSDMLAFAIPRFLCSKGYSIVLKTGEVVNSPTVKLRRYNSGWLRN